MPYAIKGNTVIKKNTGEVVGHSKNPKKYLRTLQAVEHGWKPKHHSAEDGKFIDERRRHLMDLGEITKILTSNKDKNFVDRVLNRENYPTLNLGNGNYATHKMSWSTVGNKAIVYPNIIYSPDTKSLIELSPDDAFQYAMKNKEYIQFDDPNKADEFSQQYKKYWNMQDQINSMNKVMK